MNTDKLEKIREDATELWRQFPASPLVQLLDFLIAERKPMPVIEVPLEPETVTVKAEFGPASESNLINVQPSASGELQWLKGRVKELREEVSALQRDSHPPADLGPLVAQEVLRCMQASCGLCGAPVRTSIVCTSCDSASKTQPEQPKGEICQLNDNPQSQSTNNPTPPKLQNAAAQTVSGVSLSTATAQDSKPTVAGTAWSYPREDVQTSGVDSAVQPPQVSDAAREAAYKCVLLPDLSSAIQEGGMKMAEKFRCVEEIIQRAITSATDSLEKQLKQSRSYHHGRCNEYLGTGRCNCWIMSAGVANAGRYDTKVKELEDQLAAKDAEKSEMIKAHADNLIEMQGRIDEKDAELSAMHANWRDDKDKLQRMIQTIAVKDMEITELRKISHVAYAVEQAGRLGQSIADLTTERDSLRHDLEQSMKQADRYYAERNSLRQQLEQICVVFPNPPDRSSLPSAVHELSKQRDTLKRELDKINGVNRSESPATWLQLYEQAEGLKRELEDTRTDASAMEAMHEETRKELEEAKAKLDYVHSMGLRFGMMTSSDKPHPYLMHTWTDDSDHELMFQEWSDSIGWQDKLAQSERQCAAMRDCLCSWKDRHAKYTEERDGYVRSGDVESRIDVSPLIFEIEACIKEAEEALSDAGRDYVHKSEVEKAVEQERTNSKERNQALKENFAVAIRIASDAEAKLRVIRKACE